MRGPSNIVFQKDIGVRKGPTWITDNTEVEKGLSELYRLVTASGGWLHPDLRIVNTGAALYVESGLPAEDSSRIMGIPASLMAPVDAFDLAIVDDELRANGVREALGSDTVAAMECLLAIYNGARKVPAFRRQHPLLSLAPWPELIEYLLAGRAGNPKVEALGSLFREGRWEELLKLTFLGSRVVRFQFHGSWPGERRESLMPFMDFLNHHLQGSPYKKGIFPNGPSGLHAQNAKPIPGSEETFAIYFRLDPLDSYLVYGFRDQCPPLTRSISLELNLGDTLRFEVMGRITGTFERKLPTSLQDLRMYMPKVHFVDKNSVKISHLFIPGSDAPRSLFRVLASLIKTARPDLHQETINSWARQGEAQVIEKNLHYYQKLQTLAEGASTDSEDPAPLEEVKTLARTQLDRLQSHAKRRDF